MEFIAYKMLVMYRLSATLMSDEDHSLILAYTTIFLVHFSSRKAF